jgi:hypothetical protein
MEWLGIRLRTTRAEWTPLQAAMMRDAAWRAASRTLTTIAGLAALGFGIWLIYQSFEQKRLAKEFDLDRKELFDLEISEESRVRDEVATFVNTYRNRLDTSQLSHDFELSGDSREKTLHAMILVQMGTATHQHHDYLAKEMFEGSSTNAKLWQTIHRFLETTAKRFLTDELRDRLSSTDQVTPETLLRVNGSAIVMNNNQLSQLIRNQKGYQENIITAVLDESADDINIWSSAFLDMRSDLLTVVKTSLQQNSLTASRASNAASMMNAFDDTFVCRIETLADRTTEIDEYQAILGTLLTLSVEKKTAVKAIMTKQLLEFETKLSDEHQDEATIASLRIARLALALWQLGDRSHLERVTAVESRFGITRGLAIEMLAQGWRDYGAIWEIVNDAGDQDALLAPALLSIEENFRFKYPTLSTQAKESLKQRLIYLATSHPSAEIHSVALLLLRSLGEGYKSLPKEFVESYKDSDDREWRLTRSSGLVMVRSELPDPNGGVHAFEIATTEITKGIFNQFAKTSLKPNDPAEIPLSLHHIEFPETAVTTLVARFCNWLSQIDGIPESEWCYEFEKSNQHFEVLLNRSGYRLPCFVEWNSACSAGGWDRQFTSTLETTADTSNFEPTFRLQRHAWLSNNAHSIEQLVGTKLPNTKGLYDIYGNVEEIVMDIGVDTTSISEPQLQHKVLGLRLSNHPNQQV